MTTLLNEAQRQKDTRQMLERIAKQGGIQRHKRPSNLARWIRFLRNGRRMLG